MSGPGIAPKRLWRVLFLLAVALVTWLALKPAEPGYALFLHADKVKHAAAFAMLAWLGWRSAWWSRPVLFAVLVGYGVGVEVAQSFTPTRSAELLDVVADSVGAGLFLWWARGRAA